MDWNGILPTILTTAAGVLTVLAGVYKHRTDAKLAELKQHADAQMAVQKQLYEQMREQIDAQQQTILFLSRRVNELEEARAREFAETEQLREETEQLRDEVGQLRRWGVEVLGLMEAATMTLPEAPPVLKAARERARKRTRKEGNNG